MTKTQETHFYKSDTVVVNVKVFKMTSFFYNGNKLEIRNSLNKNNKLVWCQLRYMYLIPKRHVISFIPYIIEIVQYLLY